jgi:hypothetical protein
LEALDRARVRLEVDAAKFGSYASSERQLAVVVENIDVAEAELAAFLGAVEGGGIPTRPAPSCDSTPNQPQARFESECSHG